MTRKLLPYEHQLVEALGISEEEYLDFVASQPVYEDIKEGTVLDVRNAEATVALVLAIVGALAQVASVLLTPKPVVPQAPESARGIAPSQDQRVMPRFGFNGSQDLATYGTTIPLIYTNTAQNINGGVRVNTSLLWSAILSLGGNQFMRLLLNVGAGDIEEIDVNRIAIGQLPLRDYAQSNIWAYWNPQGYPRFNQLLNRNNQARDPVNDGSETRATASLSSFRNGRAAYGFSQAFSPSTNSSCSITGVIPVNVSFDFINSSGDKQPVNVDTRLENFSDWFGQSARAGQELVLAIPDNSANATNNPILQAVQKVRYAEAATAFLGAKFKLGGAIFRVTSISGQSLDFSAIFVRLVCEEPGRFPRTGYLANYYPALLPQATSPLNVGTTISIYIESGGAVTFGRDYTIVSDGNLASSGTGTGAIVRALETSEGGKNVGFLIVQGGQGYSPEGTYRIATDTAREVVTRTPNPKLGTGYSTKSSVVPYYGTFSIPEANLTRDPRSNQEQRAVYYNKCFAQIEEAYYATATKCQCVEFALKLTAYRRLSGRASVYGSEQRDYGYSDGDNGSVMRTSMFRVYWRFAGATKWKKVRYIFAFRASNEQSIFTYFKFIRSNQDFSAPLDPTYWEFKLVPVVDPAAESGTDGYCYLVANAGQQTISANGEHVRMQFNGNIYGYSAVPPLNKVPKDINEWDLFNYDSASQSQFSFEQGPELAITAVNEQLLKPWSDYGRLHFNMATLGLHALATTTTKDLRSVSVWVNKGKKVRPLDIYGSAYNTDAQINGLIDSPLTVSSSYAPDIFLDTVLDEQNGIGQYASIHSVDVPKLAEAKHFCFTNKLFMDGAIADQRSWREFWSQVAPFSLLELARVGGKDTLVPAVPFDVTTGAVLNNAALPISALFTAGNILEGSYKEEFLDYGATVQDVVVSVIYRDTERNDVFPRNATVEVRLNDTDSNSAVLETIDASQYVTTRRQAVMLAKFLCLTKRHIRRAIEFKTFPTDSPVFPGAYVYVEIGMNQWNSIYSGRIEAGGALNAPLPRQVPNGTYTVYVYRGGEGTAQLNNVVVTDNVAPALSSYEDGLFVLGRSFRNKRVFRVTEVAMDEEGETTIKAVEHPTTSNGRSLIAIDLMAKQRFYVDEQLS